MPNLQRPENALRQLARGARDALHRNSPIVGHWDTPRGVVSAPPGKLFLDGWAFASNGLSNTEVQLLLNGEHHSTVRPDERRPDVANVHGSRAARCGWTLELTVDESMDQARLEVVALSDASRKSLGRRRLAVSSESSSMPLGTAGAIDRPAAGKYIDSAVIEITGWVVIGGRPADTIDIFVGDLPPIRARRCEPSPHLGGRSGTSGAHELCAGFSAMAPLRGLGSRDKITLHARAVGRGGKIWQSESLTLKIAPQREPTALPGPSLVQELTIAADSSTARPRICVFTHSFRLGGGELYLQELLLRLAKLDFADFLVVSPSDGVLRSELESAGIDVHIGVETPTDPRGYIDRVSELCSLLVTWRCDVVVANTLLSFGAVDAATTLGLPAVWAIHESFDLDIANHIFFGWEQPRPEVFQRQAAALQGAHTLIFESEATQDMYRTIAPEARTRCIRYGIDLTAIARYETAHDKAAIRTELGYADDDRVFLCMGSFESRKAQLALVYAFAEIVDAHPHAKLILVGYQPSDYAQAVVRCIQHSAIGSSVQVIDSQQDTYRWYMCADVLVSASDIESLPRSFMESMAFGAPILAADVFGVPEIVTDSSNGWTFDARNGTALAAGLLRAVTTSPVDLAAMSKQCREDALQFDGGGYATEYQDLLVELAANAHDGQR